MITSPALRRAQAAFLARRAARGPRAGRPPSQARHDVLQAAYSVAGQNDHGPKLYFRILYCPDCLRGHVTDLVREVPADMPLARDLGIRQLRPWRPECPERGSRGGRAGGDVAAATRAGGHS